MLSYARGVDQRKKLLEAAITCLQQRGYARTTTRDIVATAGAHLPAVNYYFGSKDHLLQEAVTESMRRWLDTTLQAAAGHQGADPARRLRAGMGGYLASLPEHRPALLAAVEAYAQAGRSPELGDHLGAAHRDATETIAQSMDDGEGLDERDRRGLAAVLLALFDGLALQWLLAPDGVPDADDVTRALALLGEALNEET